MTTANRIATYSTLATTMRVLRAATVSVVASVVLAACGGAPEEPGVLIQGQRLAVVDVHLHSGSWDMMPPTFHERLTERVPRGFKWTVKLLSDRNLKGACILGQLDAAGSAAICAARKSLGPTRAAPGAHSRKPLNVPNPR